MREPPHTDISAASRIPPAASAGKRPIWRMRSSAPSEVSHGERRRPHLYGRRKGPKLSAHQAGLFQTLLPELALDIRAGADPRSYFSEPVEDIWLEIGFGAGEHLLWQAQHHPNVG